jgi:hypothetical protein
MISADELKAFSLTQTRFAKAVFGGGAEETTAAADLVVKGLTPERRLAIYRHNVFSTLTNALRDLYPVVEAIVGKTFFDAAALQLVIETPSVSGDLNRFGEGFSTFLGGYPHAAELGYLADVALLEWHWHCAFHAADTPVLDVSKLAAIAPDRLGDTVFELAPGAALLQSAYPLLTIWQVNQPGYSGDWEVDWENGETCLLVYRDEYEVAILALERADFEMLGAISSGATLETAFESVAAEHPEFDLQGFLARFVQLRIITNFRTPT